MHGIPARSEDQRIKPLAGIPENTEAAFAVILAGIFDDDSRCPVQLPRQVKRLTATFEIGGLLGGVVSDLHGIYCTHSKSFVQQADDGNPSAGSGQAGHTVQAVTSYTNQIHT